MLDDSPVQRPSDEQVGVLALEMFGPSAKNATYLPSQPSAIHRLPRGLLVGNNRGEFGGDLWWFPEGQGAERVLGDANVTAIVEMDSRVFVIEGLDHLGMSRGAVLEVHQSSSGVEISFVADLPANPWPLWVRDGLLLGASQIGVLEISLNGVVRVLPCVGGEPTTNERAIAAYRDRTNSRFDHLVYEVMDGHRREVEACFDTVPDASTLHGRATMHFPVNVLFELSDEGRVIDTKNHPSNVEPPGVANCIAVAARDWAFPGVEYPAGAFVYRFCETPAPGTQPDLCF